jgi:hypothetical protein
MNCAVSIEDFEEKRDCQLQATKLINTLVEIIFNKDYTLFLKKEASVS